MADDNSYFIIPDIRYNDIIEIDSIETCDNSPRIIPDYDNIIGPVIDNRNISEVE